MLKPVIRKYRSDLSPWQVFQNIHGKEDVCFFLDSIQHHIPDQNYSYIAFSPFLELQILTASKSSMLSVSGSENKNVPAGNVFKEMRRLLKKYRHFETRTLPYFSGGALGYWGYEMVSFFEKIRFKNKPRRITQPVFYQGFFKDVIVYDHKNKIYLLISNAENSRAAAVTAARSKIKKMERFFCEVPPSFPQASAALSCRPDLTKKEFVSMVKKAKAYIRAGDIYQANLSQRFSLEFAGSKLKIYDKLRTINPSPFASFVKIRDIEIISSSPERLISKKGFICETRPIAGTRPVKKQKSSLAKIKNELLTNDKERAEHIMLVDLERNDLGRVCDWRSVKVRDMMTLEKYSHVIHIVSKITGRLKKPYDALDLLCAMFPGGTITGCPKIRCMEVIDELEPSGRGLYTGSIGYIDFRGNMDLNIVIRTLVFNGKSGTFQVGAGIVYDSDPVKEYEETLHKGEALVEALRQVSKPGRRP